MISKLARRGNLQSVFLQGTSRDINRGFVDVHWQEQFVYKVNISAFLLQIVIGL